MPSSESLFESRTLTGMLLHQAELSADKVALTIVGEDLTYADLVEGPTRWRAACSSWGSVS